MHIPDSVLSPATSALATTAMLPVWGIAARQVKKSLGTRQVPLLALGAAFCFTVMMFNIPAPGGTTAHPVAGTLLAILLGPWAACIGISVALLIQALFFGDGGLVAYGANCFTMAFVLPFVGYFLYRLLAARREQTSGLIPILAGAGSYFGICAAAVIVAILLGIQPALFHEPNGHALYFPFGLHITLPAMLGTHLVVAGPAEAIVTVLVVRYLQAARLPLYGFSAAGSARTEGEDQTHRLLSVRNGAAEHTPAGALRAGFFPQRPFRAEMLWIGLLTLVALSPLGLLAKGEAWGEWDARGVTEQTEKVYGTGKGYTPAALARAEEHGYHGVRGLEDYASGDGRNRLGYLGAGLLGVGAIVGSLVVGGRLLARRKEEGAESSLPSRPDDSSRGTQTAAPDELPAWLRTSSEPGETALPETGERSNRFVERTLKELSFNAANAMNSEAWAKAPGMLQQIDPRAKVIALLGLIGMAAGVRNPLTLVVLYGLGLLLGIVSRLPIGLLVRRVWLAVPLFVGALILPALLNVVTPGREICVLWQQPHLAITRPGLLLSFTLLLRVGTAVSFALLLTLTTHWNDLLRALRALFVPRLFLSVLAMTYRYLAVLMQSSAEMFTARQSRTVGAVTDAQGRRFVGVSIGALFGRTVAMADEVHAAMLSRGYNGEMRTLSRWKWRHGDTLWTLGVLLVALLMWKQG